MGLLRRVHLLTFLASAAAVSLVPVSDASACGEKLISRRPKTPRKIIAAATAPSRQDKKSDATMVGALEPKKPIRSKPVAPRPHQAHEVTRAPVGGDLGTVTRAPTKAVSALSVELYFGLGSSQAGDAGDAIARVQAHLQEDPSATLVIEGHTDASGSAEANQRLSVRRANTVRALLLKETGASPSRVVVKGFGESAPLYGADDARNRRVVIRSR